MKIYDLPGIVREAFQLSFTPNNIINSFRKSGIWPCNESIFADTDFSPPFVTDRPIPTSQETENVQDISANDVSNDLNLSLGLEPSLIPEIEKNMPNIDVSLGEVIDQISASPISQTVMSVETSEPPLFARPATPNDNPIPGPSSRIFDLDAVRPLPTAAPRAVLKRKRLRKSAILTDTPEKTALEEEANLKNNKKTKTMNTKKTVSKDRKNKGKGKGKGKNSAIKRIDSVKKKFFRKRAQMKMTLYA